MGRVVAPGKKVTGFIVLQPSQGLMLKRASVTSIRSFIFLKTCPFHKELLLEFRRRQRGVGYLSGEKLKKVKKYSFMGLAVLSAKRLFS